MHADQNLWGIEYGKVPFTYGVRDLEVGLCAKPGARLQKVLACRLSDVLAGCSDRADDATVRFQPLHPDVRFWVGICHSVSGHQACDLNH